MDITYNDTKKDLPVGQLHDLFISAGWSDGSENKVMIEKYNIPFINSTLVISAWDNELLVGVVRVLSDKMFRSVIYDLVILPAYQNQKIGKELLKRCIEHYPNSEWLVQTTNQISGYYKKNGFRESKDTFLTIACKLFTVK